ncbi:hypothetical protein H9Q13_14235 [Pontibacter sp. JH31]|uniref:Uncharacterized protein n=1 Tax=Pontibacter aquaedesilientis TaxID=2766980 RepID=A0ABR7XK58_9BACT|nr:hypothetical protein [Pontibacter aquaedesilientis]MBD1398326.1 hypothetical protein [Pontibacter aquaedesilientis]
MLIEVPVLPDGDLLLLPFEEDEDDLADLVSEVLPVVLEPDFALADEDKESEPEVLLPLFEDEEPKEAEVPEPMLPWLDELISEPLWLEVPDDRPLDILPDWLED